MNPGHDRDAQWPEPARTPVSSAAAASGGTIPPEPTPPEPATAGAPLGSVGPDDDEQLTMSPRTAVLLLSGFVSVALVAAAFLMPVHYAVLRPGPALNTLGTENGKDLIAVIGRQSYPTTGALDLTTVSVFGGPGSHVELYQVVAGWLDRSVAVVPEEEVFPRGQTAEQSEEENQREMVSSQETATAAALTSLGIPFRVRIEISGIDPKAPAAKVLRAKDVIVSINGVRVDTFPALQEGLDRGKPGEAAAFVVERGGKDVPLQVTTRADDSGRNRIGAFIYPNFTFPFQVKIQIEDIGGPSAGTMFALGIIDKLTPGSMTGGKQIAGTGTMDAAGKVGQIGGIRQKLAGARRAGAAWFLAPADNCDEVLGHVPAGLNVVRVSTLDEARAAVEKIGKGAAATELPACTAPVD